MLFLLSLVALLGCSTGPDFFMANHRGANSQPAGYWRDGNRDLMATERLSPVNYANVMNLLESDDPMLALYREDITHNTVKEFFIRLTGSEETALPALYHAEKRNLSPAIVFSLMWVESRFNSQAINRNATSTDRGLFQLNSRSFPKLGLEDFFDPETSARHGTEYLSYAFGRTVDPRTAVAIYNAGPSRVLAGQTPASTLVYVDRIMEYRETLNWEFRRFIKARFPAPAIPL